MTSPVAEDATRAWGYQPALDGLRGVAVLAVLLFHAGWIDGGWLGVSTFFTLSGFLITTILLEGRRAEPAVPLRRFWARRARRLLPAAWLALVGVLAFGATVADATQLARLRGDVLAALGYVANWRFVASDESYTELFRSPSPVLHFWSLAIEEQFYLLFPVVLLAAVALVAWTRRSAATGPVRDRRLAAVLAAGALGSTAWLAVLDGGPASFDRLYYGTDTRMAELLTGAAVGALLGGRAVLGDPRRRAWAGRLGLGALGLLVGAYGTTALGDGRLFRGGLQVVAVLGAVVIVGALQPGSAVGRVLSFEPLRRLGLVSYGAYLFHWPIFLWLQGEGWGRLAVLLAGGGVTVVAAEASYRWLEHPIRSHARLTASPARLAAPALALVTVVGLTVIVTDDPPQDPLALLAAAEAEAEVVDAPPTPPTAPAPAAEHEQPGASPPLPRVMVVGDSVSWFLGEGIEDHAATEGSVVAWNVGTFGCGIARGGELLLSSGPAPPEADCDDWKTRWDRPLRQFGPDVVVVLTGLWDLADRRPPGRDGFVHVGEPLADRYLVDEYAAAVDLLGRRGARIVWLTAPCYAETIFPGPLAGTNALRPERQRWLNEHVLPALVEARPEVHLVDLAARVCPTGGFTPDLLDERFDGVHFTEDAALEVAGWLVPQIVEVARRPAPPVDQAG